MPHVRALLHTPGTLYDLTFVITIQLQQQPCAVTALETEFKGADTWEQRDQVTHEQYAV